MSVAIIITETGFARADAALAKIENFRPEPMLEGIARRMQEQTRDRIEAGGPAPDGSAWAKSSNPKGKTLHLSGALAETLQYSVNGNQITLGSGLIYAAIHQYGGPIVAKRAAALAFWIGNAFIRVKKVEIPARPYLGLSAENRAEIIDEVAAYIRRLIG